MKCFNVASKNNETFKTKLRWRNITVVVTTQSVSCFNFYKFVNNLDLDLFLANPDSLPHLLLRDITNI